MSKDLTTEKELVEEIALEQPSELEEKVISIDRISRTVKGGRRIRFRAVVVIGDRQGRVGLGVAKAGDVQSAIAKAKARAQKAVFTVALTKGTIERQIKKRFGSATVLLKPAPEGHSIIAGGAVRSVVELSGIRNIVSKLLGSTNAINSAMATVLALKELTDQRRSNQ